MNNRLSYAAITLLLTAAAVATWIVFPPGAVGGPAIEPAVHTRTNVQVVPGIAEQFQKEKASAREDLLPAQF